MVGRLIGLEQERESSRKERSNRKKTLERNYGKITMKEQPQQRSKIHLLIHLEPNNQEMVQDN